MREKEADLITWTVKGRMSHCNILPLVIQELQLTHNLTLVLFNLINFFVTECKALQQPFSMHTKIFIY